MRIPGFTAEASLYRTGERFRAAGAYGREADGRRIITPQWYGCYCRPINSWSSICACCHSEGGVVNCSYSRAIKV
jgi:hypothetical protein